MKLDRLKLAVLTGLGTGRIPAAGGTWASVLAAGIWVALAFALGEAARPWLDVITGGLIILASMACVGWGRWIIQRTGRSDPQEVTIDEFAGQWLALWWIQPVLQAGAAAHVPAYVVIPALAGLQLLLFRVLDIFKPGPIRQLEQLPAGWGILADDLMAGFLANVAGRLLFLGWLSMHMHINPFEKFS